MWFIPQPFFAPSPVLQQQVVMPAPYQSSSTPPKHLTRIRHSKKIKKTKKHSPSTTFKKVLPAQTAVSAPSISSTTVATSSPQGSPKNEAQRITDPYPNISPQSWDTINNSTRAALVNILCDSRNGPLQPISGSGVIIDSRGVILTNAHVAQYVLLSESPHFNLACHIRTGSPAVSRYRVEVLYIPPVWIDAHVADIINPRPTGTGEHDYALLRIVDTTNGSQLPSAFPYLKPDVRETIAFTGDSVLGAAYPAEFNGVGATIAGLNAVSSVSSVEQLLTFSSSTVDLFSIGSVIEAQEGSSGGSVVNAWGYLVGIITTTSEGVTTAQRDLRAVAASYINRDIQAQTGSSLSDFISGDLVALEANFNINQAPNALKHYIQALSHY